MEAIVHLIYETVSVLFVTVLALMGLITVATILLPFGESFGNKE